jgi:T-complex protein 1 subunit zeta
MTSYLKTILFSEVNSGFFYKTAEEREKLALAERDFIEQRVKKVIELKRKVCPPGSGKSFVVINQKVNIHLINLIYVQH